MQRDLTRDDVRALVTAARGHGMELALDIEALQAEQPECWGTRSSGRVAR